MRFALRKQQKIKVAFSEKTLNRILDSLTQYFKYIQTIETDIKQDPNSKYNLLAINDIGHTCGIVVFYIISTRYDVYNLAFKEFIN